MKFILAFIALVAIGGFSLYLYFIQSPYSAGVKRTIFGKEESMEIKSSFENKESIPYEYTCDGENVSPPLTFRTVPVTAKSLVIIMEDKDSEPKDFTHWLVYDIKPEINGVYENSIPEGGVEGYNDFGEPTYNGPCPLSEAHSYVIKMYALDTKIGLARGATKGEVIAKMKGHIIEDAELIGTYKRQ